MKTKLLALALAPALALAVACGDDTEENPNPNPSQVFDTADKVYTAIDGQTWKMLGTNIPSHPNGYPSGWNLGSVTQCYYSATISSANRTFTVSSEKGTMQGNPGPGAMGTCDTTTKAGDNAPYPSNALLIENVKSDGSCFDITVTFTGFSQEGRGKLSADGKTMTLELFFGGQAVNHRCANGAVGSSGVTITYPGQSPAPFTGNAQQVYVRQ